MRSKLLTSIGIILLAHYIAVFMHEYAHSSTAWLLGYKGNPFDIDYGGTSLWNLLFLIHIDEKVNYAAVFAAGRPLFVALIAFAGSGIGNALGYLLSLYLLQKKDLPKNTFLFVYWFCFMNLANFYDYIPIRTFSNHGDMGHLAQGMGISAWTICGAFGIPVAVAIWHFFSRAVPKAYRYLERRYLRVCLLVVSTVLLFGYFGLAGYSGYGSVSRTLSLISVMGIPFVMFICWPAIKCDSELHGNSF